MRFRGRDRSPPRSTLRHSAGRRSKEWRLLHWRRCRERKRRLVSNSGHTSLENEIHFDLSRPDIFLGEWRLEGQQHDGPFMKRTGVALRTRCLTPFQRIAGSSRRSGSFRLTGSPGHLSGRQHAAASDVASVELPSEPSQGSASGVLAAGRLCAVRLLAFYCCCLPLRASPSPRPGLHLKPPQPGYRRSRKSPARPFQNYSPPRSRRNGACSILKTHSTWSFPQAA